MKNLILLFVLTLTFGCSKDGDSSNQDSAEANTGQGGSLASFTVVGDYLYTVDESSLNIFNVINSEQPVKVNDLPIGFRIETLFNFREYLYIGSRDGMFIYSIENPEEPSYVSDVQHFTACDPVIANETHAFVTLHSNTQCGNDINLLEIYDINHIVAPALVSSRNLTSPKGIGLYGDFLFVCDDEVKIFNVTNPVESVLVHSINKEVFDVIIKGDLLILIGDTGLYQYSLDSGNIENIQLLSSIAI